MNFFFLCVFFVNTLLHRKLCNMAGTFYSFLVAFQIIKHMYKHNIYTAHVHKMNPFTAKDEFD